MIKLIISLLIFVLPVLALADQNAPELGALFPELKAAPDSSSAFIIEQKIWRAWLNHDNPQYRNLMVSGINLMNRGDIGAALAAFNQLVKVAPEYAEAWNKRATIHYLLGNYQASESDIEQTLMLEPFHFGALSGLGLVKLAQGRYLEARSTFYAVLEIYPRMDSVKQNLAELDNFLRQNSI